METTPHVVSDEDAFAVIRIAALNWARVIAEGDGGPSFTTTAVDIYNAYDRLVSLDEHGSHLVLYRP